MAKYTTNNTMIRRRSGMSYMVYVSCLFRYNAIWPALFFRFGVHLPRSVSCLLSASINHIVSREQGSSSSEGSNKEANREAATDAGEKRKGKQDERRKGKDRQRKEKRGARDRKETKREKTRKTRKKENDRQRREGEIQGKKESDREKDRNRCRLKTKKLQLLFRQRMHSLYWGFGKQQRCEMG